MEELTKFLNLVKKYRLVLIIVPIVTVVITYFLVRNLPDSYVSQAQIATGIVDDTKQNLLNQAAPQSQQIVQEFSNLVALMKMKKNVDEISYQLLQHDLSDAKSFRKPSKKLAELDANAKRRMIQILQDLRQRNASLNLFNAEQKQIYDVLNSMRYDSESLKDKLNAYRAGDSDFIIVEFESENPDLSAFVVNTVSNTFINYYTQAVKSNQNKTTNFLRDLLAKKSDTMAKKMNNLRDYKVKNKVLNLDDQSKQMYTQIADYNNQKQALIQKTSSLTGTLNEIDKKFKPGERQYLEAGLSKLNQRIVNTKDELSGLYDLYYKNDLDERYKRSIDSLQHKLEEQINRSSDAYIVNPMNTKQELMTQKLTLEVDLDMSRYSIGSLERELSRLNAQYDQLVPREADVQRLGMDIDIATKEYLDILNRYNQSTLESDFDPKLTVVQAAIPGVAQPSKKMLLVILSGLISIVFCLVIFFVIYYFDDSIVTASDLANATQAPVLGSLKAMNAGKIDLETMWKQNSNLSSEREFKNELRSIRYEIEQDVKDKIIAVTSIDPMEGKSLLSLSLAYAWKMTGHKVLLIDGNFNAPFLREASESPTFLEDFLQDKSPIKNTTPGDGQVTILGNRGGDTSILELANQEVIRRQLAWAATVYDIIIIETGSLTGINQSKEWFMFVNAIIGIFKSGNTISGQKRIFVDYLKDSGSFKGWVINQVPVNTK